MKKTSISILYDSEKLSAVKMYLEQKDTDIKEELEKAMDSLYIKYVPINVREFIDMKSSNNTRNSTNNKNSKSTESITQNIKNDI